MTKSIQIALVAFSVSLGVLITPTLAHRFYSVYCCDEKDSMVETKEGGVEYTNNGIKYTVPKNNVYPSEDNQYHFCIYNGVGRCAYVQQGS